jgi:hypothetical protein
MQKPTFSLDILVWQRGQVAESSARVALTSLLFPSLQIIFPRLTDPTIRILINSVADPGYKFFPIPDPDPHQII